MPEPIGVVKDDEDKARDNQGEQCGQEMLIFKLGNMETHEGSYNCKNRAWESSKT